MNCEQYIKFLGFKVRMPIALGIAWPIWDIAIYLRSMGVLV